MTQKEHGFPAPGSGDARAAANDEHARVEPAAPAIAAPAPAVAAPAPAVAAPPAHKPAVVEPVPPAVAPAAAAPAKPASPTAASTPPSPPGSSGPPHVARVAAIAGTAGAVFGLLVGLAIGSKPATATAPAPTTGSAVAVKGSAAAAPAVASSAPPVARGPRTLVADLGAPDPLVRMDGPWSDVQLGQRSAARLAFTASLATTLVPAEGAYGLAIVTRADEPNVAVGIRVNGKDVARWTIPNSWSMQGVVLGPGTLRSGENTIEFGMPPPVGDQAVAIVMDSLHLAPLAAEAQATVGMADVAGSLVDGYYGREGEGEAARTWSAGKRTTLGLMLEPTAKDYDIDVAAAAFGTLVPLKVEARVNGKSVGSVTMDDSAKFLFHASAGQFVRGLNTVELVYSKTIKPSQVDKASKDERELAVRIASVTARPAASP